ncbi:DUF4328 domain-containing protein [Intrasporangium sp. DVR]|uniref:DUF4328 domain-containing protein n=1 Tax=Intrasporangium sp. DVR TaxID=3127867 RepID=UPI00313A6D94
MNPHHPLDPHSVAPPSGPPLDFPPPPGTGTAPGHRGSPLPAFPIEAAWRRPWSPTGDVLGRLTVGLLAAAILLQLVNVWLNLRGLTLLARGDVDGLVALSERLEMMPALSVAGYVATGIVFLSWLRFVWVSDRSHPDAHRLSDGLAVGGWVIPLANLVLSGKALTQLWHGADAARARDLGTSRDLGGTPPVVMLWWVGWLLMALAQAVGRDASRQLDRATGVDEMLSAAETSMTIDAWASGVTSATGALLIVVVLRVMAMVRR